MTPEEADAPDEPFDSWLAVCDEMLAAGATPALPDDNLLSPELRRRLEEGLVGLRLLHGWKPRGPAPLTVAAAAAPAPAPQLPWRTLGRFQLRGELGRGGFGIVFLAYDPHLRREVALKVPYPELGIDPAMRERFQREAQAASKLDHPNLVPVYEVGEEAPVCFIVSAFCPGVTLAQWLKARSEPVPFREAAWLAAVVADAIAYAHRQGVIHRDLKPANILLRKKSEATGDRGPDSALGISDFEPKVTDFGLAKQLAGADAAEASANPTRTGAVLGTPSYMAPEQARGRRREIGPAADVYALGAILYELLVGRPPFRGESDVDTLVQVQSEEVMPPARLRPRLPRDLETICLKCLQKEPKSRYAGAADLADDLHRFLRGEPVRARRIGPAGQAWRWCRRQPGTASLVSAVATLLLLVAGGATLAAAWERGLSAAAERAKADEQTQRRRAEELLERQYVERAVRFMDQGNLPESLPWIVEGLRLMERNQEREEIQRKRLGAALRYMPRPEHVWFHDGPVASAEFNPDGSRVVTAGQDGTVRVWDTATGAPVTPPLRHKKAVCCARFSPDGRFVVTASVDTTARVWDAATGEPVTDFLRHDGPLTHAGFSPDSTRVVTAGEGGTATVWDVQTGTATLKLLGHSSTIHHVAFSPDGARIVTASRDNTARVWDARTGKQVALLRHEGQVFHAAFSPNSLRVVTAAYPYARVWEAATGKPVGKPLGHVTNVLFATFSPDPDGLQVATASADNAVQVWEAQTGLEVTPRLNHPGQVNTVQFSADGGVVVSACNDGTVRLWDRWTRAPLPWCPRHAGPVRSAWLSPDGRRLLTASADGTARLWDLSVLLSAGADATDRLWNMSLTDVPCSAHGGLVYHGSFNADGSRAATASWDGTVRLWDVASGKPRPAQPLKHAGGVRRVWFSPDDRYVLTASLDGKARVWNADTGEQLWVLPHGDEVLEASFNRAGDRVLTVTKAGTARLWDATAREELTRPQMNALAVAGAEWSPDGKMFVTAGRDHYARLWDASTGDLLRTFDHSFAVSQEHAGLVSQASFSRDGQQLLTVVSDTAWVWETATGKALAGPLKHGGQIVQASFSPDGARVLTAGHNSSARVWRVETGRPVTPPMLHAGRLESASFSPDGRLVVTASLDGTARVWDAATGEPITPPLRHGNCVWSATFSPDGRQVLTTSGDRTARLWEIPLESRPLAELVQMAQVLTGLEMREAGQLVPLNPDRFASDWADLNSRYPRAFPCRRAGEMPDAEQRP